MIEELILKTRSYRRFDESVPVKLDTLRWLVTLARFSASGSNRQPLKFILSCDAETNGSIFPHTRWAGYLTGWGGPAEGERPAAYIVILGDSQIREAGGVDHCQAVQAEVLVVARDRAAGRAGRPAVLVVQVRLHVQLTCLLDARANAFEPFLGEIFRGQTHAGVHKKPTQAHLMHYPDLPPEFFRIQQAIPCPERLAYIRRRWR